MKKFALLMAFGVLSCQMALAQVFVSSTLHHGTCSSKLVSYSIGISNGNEVDTGVEELIGFHRAPLNQTTDVSVDGTHFPRTYSGDSKQTVTLATTDTSLTYTVNLDATTVLDTKMPRNTGVSLATRCGDHFEVTLTEAVQYTLTVTGSDTLVPDSVALLMMSSSASDTSIDTGPFGFTPGTYSGTLDPGTYILDGYALQRASERNLKGVVHAREHGTHSRQMSYSLTLQAVPRKP